jgi:hypothetical protein
MILPGQPGYDQRAVPAGRGVEQKGENDKLNVACRFLFLAVTACIFIGKMMVNSRTGPYLWENYLKPAAVLTRGQKR